MKEASALCRLLGDEARLRILRVLARERLNVTELTGVLGIAQSGVSRHLGLLRDAGLVEEAKEGGFTYYRIAANGDGSLPAQLLAALGPALATADDPVSRADEARLKEVLRLRKESFAEHGLEGRRQLVPGRSWAAWARALGHLLPPLTVADLGCGEGYLTIEAARWARAVIAVDRSPEMLERARGLARRRGVENVRWQEGEIEALPIGDATVDVALLSQSLHHAEVPARAVAEAARITLPGGRVLVLDLRTHDQTWVRDQLGDRWLGFEPDQLGTLLRHAGLRDVRVQVGARLAGDPFTVLIASGRKPSARRAPARRASSRS